MAAVAVVRSPLAVAKRFSAHGETGLVSAYRAGCPSASEGFENIFALRAAEYRDSECVDGKANAAIDFLWNMWCGLFDEEIKEHLCSEASGSPMAGFLWHRYLTESSKAMGTKYRVFVEACSAGPIV